MKKHERLERYAIDTVKQSGYKQKVAVAVLEDDVLFPEGIYS